MIVAKSIFSRRFIPFVVKKKILSSNPQLNDKKTVEVIKKILDKNDHEAAHNRAHFNNHGVLAK